MDQKPLSPEALQTLTSLFDAETADFMAMYAVAHPRVRMLVLVTLQKHYADSASRLASILQKEAQRDAAGAPETKATP